MEYRLVLRRGEAAGLVGGTAAAGLLLFLSGMAVGSGVDCAPGRTPARGGGALVDAGPDSVASAVSEPAPAAMPTVPAPDASAPQPAAVPQTIAWQQDGVGGPGEDADLDSIDAFDPPLPPARGPRDAGRPPAQWQKLAAAMDRRGWGRLPEADESSLERLAARGPFAVSVATLTSEYRAMTLLDELGAKGHEAYLVSTADRRGQVTYEVRAGRYYDRAQAEEAARAFALPDQPAPRVVPAELPYQ